MEEEHVLAVFIATCLVKAQQRYLLPRKSIFESHLSIICLLNSILITLQVLKSGISIKHSKKIVLFSKNTITHSMTIIISKKLISVIYYQTILAYTTHSIPLCLHKYWMDLHRLSFYPKSRYSKLPSKTAFRDRGIQINASSHFSLQSDPLDCIQVNTAAKRSNLLVFVCDCIANCLIKWHPEPVKRSHIDEHYHQLFASKRPTRAQQDCNTTAEKSRYESISPQCSVKPIFMKQRIVHNDMPPWQILYNLSSNHFSNTQALIVLSYEQGAINLPAHCAATSPIRAWRLP